MINGLLGTKLGMTQVFSEDGERIPVTVIQAGPCTVIQKKTQDIDGYDAAQIGFKAYNKAKAAKQTKAKTGHFKGQEVTRFMREFSVDDIATIEVGQTFDVTLFAKGQIVDVSGTTKGHGFSGVMKRHNFKGGPGAHGHRFNRGTGSIGQSATPSRVFKNKKMPGQYGNVQNTVQNLEIIEVDTELNVIMVRGSVPGANGRLVEITRAAKTCK
ncbi:MAG: 50S ribosomal protein L3 [SAR324 cluster bacterium]|nr:50S ribosomal protein L3 [SAR324 cluster bacterium]